MNKTSKKVLKAQGAKMPKKNAKNVIDPNSLPVWNLEEFYKGDPDVENNLSIKKDMAIISKLTADIVEDRNAISAMDVDELTELTRNYAEIIRLIKKLNSYSQLKLAENRKDPNVIKLRDKVSDITKETLNKLSWLHHELYKIPETTKLDLLFSEDVENIRFFQNWLSTMLWLEPTLSITQILSLNTISSLSEGWSNLYRDTLANAEFKVGRKTYEYNEIVKLLYSDNENEAKEARKSLYEVLNSHKMTFASALNKIYEHENASTDLTLRDEKGCLSMRVNGLEVNCIAEGFLDSQIVRPMVMAVQNYGYDISRKFYSLLAKMQGTDKMSYYHRLKNPLESEQQFYSWETARDLALGILATFQEKSYDPYDDENRLTMAEYAFNFLQTNMIHARPLPGKDTGAFAMSGKIPGLYIDDYDGTLKALLTFFHELGHIIQHMVLNQYFGTLTDENTTTKAEITSLFMELMLLKAFLGNTDLTNRQRLYYLIELAQHYIASIQRQCAFHMFERRVFEEKRMGSVPAERMNEIYSEEMQKYLGFELDPEAQNGWMTITHLFGSPFYVQSYAISGLIVNNLWTVYETGRLDDFPEKYADMLRYSGAKSLEGMLSPFGLDMDDYYFWHEGLDPINKVVNEIERLAKIEGLL